MPAEFIVLNLPPWLRYKEDNILISMLIPSTLSATSQRKYFKHVCDYELNPLATTGIPSVSIPGECIKVKVFGAALDLKGREKFLDQMSVQSYMGCSHCSVYFPKGPGGTGPCFGVARRWLPTIHPLRQQRSYPYEYSNVEAEGTTTHPTSPHIIHPQSPPHTTHPTSPPHPYQDRQSSRTLPLSTKQPSAGVPITWRIS